MDIPDTYKQFCALNLAFNVIKDDKKRKMLILFLREHEYGTFVVTGMNLFKDEADKFPSSFSDKQIDKLKSIITDKFHTSL